MRTFNLTAALATVFLALPAVALAATGSGVSDASSLPSSVLWAAGIAGFIGFMLGSIKPNDEYAATKFDMQGALIVGIAAAAFVGGLVLYTSSGAWTPALYGIGVGALLGIFRFMSTRPPRQPKNNAAADGVTRFQGDTAKAKYKAAERLYNNASFGQDRRYASRGRDWRYKSGVPQSDLAMIGESAQHPSSNTFAILVLLVRELPGEAGEPAVVVVNGTQALQKISVDGEGITVPGYDKKIPASAITGMVGYAWR